MVRILRTSVGRPLPARKRAITAAPARKAAARARRARRITPRSEGERGWRKVGGAFRSPSAPPSTPPIVDTDEQMEEDVEEKTLDHALFCEFFAGRGVLTKRVQEAGVPVSRPEDLSLGGLDFTEEDTVDKVKKMLADQAASGAKLLVHFAPPCSTFSRARDRSWKTRLRSTARPQG